MSPRSLASFVVLVALLPAGAVCAQEEPQGSGRIRWGQPRDASEPPIDALPPRQADAPGTASENDDAAQLDESAEPAGPSASEAPRATVEAEPSALDRPALPPPAFEDEPSSAIHGDGALPPPIEDAAPDGVPPRETVTASPRTLFGDHLGVWLELGVGSGGSPEESVLAVSPEVGMRYRLADAVVAEVSWGFTYGDADVRGEATLGGSPVPFEAGVQRVEPGNPILSGAWSQSFDDDVRVEVGLGVAVPTAARANPGSDSEGLAVRRASLVTHRAALAMRGYWSPWRWAPERFSLFLPARVAAPIEAVVLEGEIGVGLMFPVLGDAEAITDVVLQAAVGAGGRVAGPFHLGARLKLVGAARGLLGPMDRVDDPRDEVMFSAEPWARLRFDPVQVALRVSINLTGADGLGGERGPSFGAFASVGAEL